MSNGGNGINHYVDFGSFNDGIQLGPIFNDLKEVIDKDVTYFADLLVAGKMPALELIGEYIVKEIRKDLLEYQAHVSWEDPTVSHKEIPKHFWEVTGRRVTAVFPLETLVGLDVWKQFETSRLTPELDPSSLFGVAYSFCIALKNVLTLSSCLNEVRVRPVVEQTSTSFKMRINIEFMYRQT